MMQWFSNSEMAKQGDILSTFLFVLSKTLGKSVRIRMGHDWMASKLGIWICLGYYFLGQNVSTINSEILVPWVIRWHSPEHCNLYTDWWKPQILQHTGYQRLL